MAQHGQSTGLLSRGSRVRVPPGPLTLKQAMTLRFDRRHARVYESKIKKMDMNIRSAGAMYALTGDVLWLFPCQRISIFQPEQFRQSLSKQLKRMQQFYSLRHSFATHLLSGVYLRCIQEMPGHKHLDGDLYSCCDGRFEKDKKSARYIWG